MDRTTHPVLVRMIKINNILASVNSDAAKYLLFKWEENTRDP